MREYMPSQHRKFLEYLESVACVRQFIIDRLACHGITSDMKSDSSQSKESHEAHRSHLGGRGNQCKQGSSAGTSTETAVPKEQRADKDTKVSQPSNSPDLSKEMR
jgi:Indoleamine 2,3-dioxygenase